MHDARLACVAAGIACLGSFNEISDMTVAGMTLFDLMDFATANIMLPLGGLMICLFAGWRMKRVALEEELSLSKPWLFHAWYLAIRFVARSRLQQSSL